MSSRRLNEGVPPYSATPPCEAYSSRFGQVMGKISQITMPFQSFSRYEGESKKELTRCDTIEHEWNYVGQRQHTR